MDGFRFSSENTKDATLSNSTDKLVSISYTRGNKTVPESAVVPAFVQP